MRDLEANPLALSKRRLDSIAKIAYRVILIINFVYPKKLTSTQPYFRKTECLVIVHQSAKGHDKLHSGAAECCAGRRHCGTPSRDGGLAESRSDARLGSGRGIAYDRATNSMTIGG